MFRDRKPMRGPAGRARFSASRGAGRWSSGRVGKTYATKSATDRKLESEMYNRAIKGVPFNKNKNKAAQKDGNPAEVKTEDVQLYKQKVQITPDPERKCVENELEQIQEALLDALEPLEDGCYPQFYGSYMVKGALIISCANEQSKQWLEKIVPTLVPWEGGKLCIKPKGEVVQGTKVLLKTPKLFAKTDPKKILQMLSTQNKTLNTNTWKNISVTTEASGQTLVYVVDDQSLEAIRALNNKVYLGLGNVELVILKNEEEGEKKEEEEKDEKEEEEKAEKQEEEKKEKDDDDKQTSEEPEVASTEKTEAE